MHLLVDSTPVNVLKSNHNIMWRTLKCLNRMANSKNPIIKDVFAKLASLNSKHRHDIYIGTELGSKTNAPESSSYTRTRI